MPAIMYGVYLKIQGQVVTTTPQEMAAHPVPDFRWKDFTGKEHTIKRIIGQGGRNSFSGQPGVVLAAVNFLSC